MSVHFCRLRSIFVDRVSRRWVFVSLVRWGSPFGLSGPLSSCRGRNFRQFSVVLNFGVYFCWNFGDNFSISVGIIASTERLWVVFCWSSFLLKVKKSLLEIWEFCWGNHANDRYKLTRHADIVTTTALAGSLYLFHPVWENFQSMRSYSQFRRHPVFVARNSLNPKYLINEEALDLLWRSSQDRLRCALQFNWLHTLYLYVLFLLA